jgi:hypothetical protein
MKVTVIRSRRRRRTVSAKIVNDALFLQVPYFLSEREIDKFSHYFLLKIRKKKVVKTDKYLSERAKKLCNKFFQKKLPKFTICWSTRQKKLFGSCNHKTGKINISARLKEAPGWVIDYLILHELAHLFYPNHGRRFWRLVKRYPKTEEARAFLRGMEYQKRL